MIYIDFAAPAWDDNDRHFVLGRCGDQVLMFVPVTHSSTAGINFVERCEVFSTGPWRRGVAYLFLMRSLGMSGK